MLLDVAKYGQKVDQVALSSHDAIALLRIQLRGFGIRLRVDSDSVKKRRSDVANRVDQRWSIDCDALSR
jgi:hypothetical protein